jgi:hypothetical protein
MHMMMMMHVFLLVSSTFSNVTVGTKYQIENSSYSLTIKHVTQNDPLISDHNKLWRHEIF